MGTIGAILPYINGFVMALKEIVKLFAFFVGFTMPSGETAEFFEDVEDYSIGIGDGIGAAANNAKELKKQLQGFDALNVITTQSSSSGGGGGGGAAGLDTVSPELLKALGQYDSLMESVQMKATGIRDRIMEWLGFTKKVNEETGEVEWVLDKGYTNFEKIRDILVLIGTIFGGWKLAKGISWLMGKLQSLSLILGTGGILKTLGLISAALAEIYLALQMLDWARDNFKEQKIQIYGNKEDLSFIENLNVALSSIGAGFNEDVIEKIFGEDALQPVIQFVADVRGELEVMASYFEQGGPLWGMGASFLRIVSFVFGIDAFSVIEQWIENVQKGFTNLGKNIEKWWNNDVAPWFTIERWLELAENIQKGIEEAWNLFVDWWNNTTLVIWFNNNVMPWFTKEKWQELGNTAVTNLKTWFDSFKNTFNPLKEWWDNKVAPWFTWEKWRQLAQNAWNSLASVFSGGSFHINLPHFYWTTQPAYGWIGDILSALNLPSSLPKLNISWYAQGGLPDVGELFMAREAGPELVGSIGGQNAVMNNQQIVQAVSQGVAQAVSQVMGNGGNKYQLFIDGQQITDVVERRVGRNANLYGT